MESLSPLEALSAAIRAVLEEAVPALQWKEDVAGAGIPSVPTGTISADEIQFGRESKLDGTGTVNFSIFIIVPDQKGQPPHYAERLAMEARAALEADDSLGGAASESMVHRVVFGTAPGVSGRGAGAALISYEVQAYL